MKYRVLFTCRDVGAALQIAEIIQEFKALGFETRVIASGAGYDALTSRGLRRQRFTVDKRRHSIPKYSSHKLKRRLLNAAGDVIEKAKPDAVFCGLGSFDYGVDEAVLYWAAPGRLGIPSFQFLDTWGTFNHIKDGYPDMYFVIDEAAVRHGMGRARAPMRVVGMPRLNAYARAAPDLRRRRARKSLGLKPGEWLIGYFGQNPEAPGQMYNFKLLLRALSSFPLPFRFLLAPHPAYADKYEPLRRRLHKTAVRLIDHDCQLDRLDLLCACDITTTSFSSAAIDHAYLSSFARRPMGFVVNLLAGTPLKKYMMRQFGYWKNPILAKGIGLLADTPEPILGLFTDQARLERQKSVYHLTVKHLKYSKNPAREIAEKVRDILCPAP